MCPANYDALAAQCHDLTFNSWLPYSGTGSGRIYDIYNMRSAYAASLSTGYTFSERDTFGDDADKMQLLKKFTREYIKIRPYFSEDFYPLTEFSDKNDVWCAAQFDRPSEKDGVIQVFRRKNSPYCVAAFKLGNVQEEALYTFTDCDDERSFTLTGREIKEKGFEIEIPKPRTAKIFIYSIS